MTDSREAALDRDLAAALRPPEVPRDLHDRVMAAVAREPLPDLDRCRARLEAERRRAIAELNARYARRSRDVLLAGLLFGIPIDVGMGPLLDWLTRFSSGAAPLLAGALALGIGAACGALLLEDLFAARAAR